METILIQGAEIYYDRNFLPAEEATILFDILQTKCAWQRHRSSFKYAVPRDEAYYGDPGTNYTYSRREYKPLTWIPELFSLKTRVERATPAIAYSNLSLPSMGYNAVLCNLYRNGNDSVGLRADAEPEMGPGDRFGQSGGRTLISSQREGRRGLLLQNGCPTEACSSWRDRPRKTSSMRYQKNLVSCCRGLT